MSTKLDCVSCLSTSQMIDHGKAMLENGWTMVQGFSDMGVTIYNWHSPRDEVYVSYASNLPSVQAVEDAVSHKDYPIEMSLSLR